MQDYFDDDGIVYNEIVKKKEITEEEEIQLLKKAIIDDYTGGEWKYFQPHLKRIFEKYRGNIDKIKELESRVVSLEEENKNLNDRIEKLERRLDETDKIKKENLRLKIVSGEVKSGWKKDRDMIERDNPDTGKLEHYTCPINFNHEHISDLRYLDEHRLMVRFYHRDPLEHDSKFYEIPTDAYLWLKGVLPDQEKHIKMKIHDVNDIESMKKYISIIDEKAKLHRKYFNQFAHYLIERRGEKIKTQEIISNTKIPRGQTLYDLLHDFERWGFINDLGKGYWKVDF